MTNIVAGRFELQADADAATTELLHEGFKRNQVSSFFVNTPGQHGCSSSRTKCPSQPSNRTRLRFGTQA
jgi:hypothetical protein